MLYFIVRNSINFISDVYTIAQLGSICKHSDKGGFMFAEKLKAARMSSGLSLRALQAKIENKVSAQAIGRYERCEMKPSPDILTTLANALGVSEKYFSSSEGLRLGKLEFRENFLRSKKEESYIEAKVLKHVKHYLEIEEFLQANTLEWDQPREFPFIVRDVKDVELAAHKLRDNWKLGDDPILNLAEFFEDRGIKVIFMVLPDSVAGMTCFIHREALKKIPVIVINENVKVERQRFTLAHELGHLVLENISNINSESVCNRFASSFLMPDSILWATLGKQRKDISLGELIILKQRFHVSIQAIVYRCKDLNIIAHSTYQKLFRDFANRGWLNPPYNEPISLPKETTERFQRLCYRALTEDAITIEKAEELLGISAAQLNIEMCGSGIR